MGEITRGRSHGLSFIFFLLEKPWFMGIIGALVGMSYAWWSGGSFITVIFAGIMIPLSVAAALLGLLVVSSWMHDSGKANWEEYITIKDEALAKQYVGKKIPITTFYEAYIHEKIDLKIGMYDLLMIRNKLFRFMFVKEDIMFYLTKLLRQNLDHSSSGDHGEIAPVYDRGNDFYRFFLGPCMIYTSGIFRSEDEDLEVAQKRKLDTVCQQVQIKEGDKHLDIGCGWGTLIRHSAKHFGAISTGVSLAKEQKKWHLQQCEEEKVKNATFKVMDYREIPGDKYDAITCLEMAEHVGIKNFQTFLLQVRDLLKDDGLFYLQIAGLRRPWQYEDLLWGLFMGKYIFPAADASCPLGWVVCQLERAGFEVHRVENTGVHYSLTIKTWYDNWMGNKDKILKSKYGQYWFRMWAVFLAWSAIIAAQGSSTVFMITCNKNHKNDGHSVAEEETKFDRMKAWVGKNVIAHQQ